MSKALTVLLAGMAVGLVACSSASFETGFVTTDAGVGDFSETPTAPPTETETSDSLTPDTLVDTDATDTGELDDIGELDTGIEDTAQVEAPCIPTTTKEIACFISGTSPLTGKPWRPCGYAPDGCGGSYACGTCPKAAICVTAPGKLVVCDGCYMVAGTCTTMSGVAGTQYECSKALGPFIPVDADCRVHYTTPAVVGWCCKT